MRTLLLATTLAAAGLAGPLPPPAGTPQSTEEEAAELLAKGEAEVAKGRYKQAVQTFEKAARQYPHTSAGIEALSRTGETGYLGWSELVANGPSSNRIDVVILGDGYPLGDQAAFDEVAETIPKLFERHRVLGEYYTYHDFVKVNLTSKDSQYDIYGREYDTALEARDAGADQGRLLVTIDVDRLATYLAHLPGHDGLVIAQIRKGTSGLSGPGLAILCGTSFEGDLIHEWGHAFARLSDETASFTGHWSRIEDTPNVSYRESVLPWQHWIDAGVAGVGAYEGADGSVRGAYKPTTNCAMGGALDFCVVCREAIVLGIYRRVDPIDDASPPAQPLEGALDGPLIAAKPIELEVRVLKPAEHDLEGSWWVFPEDVAPPAPVPLRGLEGVGDRRSRGALAPIDAKPAAETRPDRNGVHSFRFKPRDYEPGRYRVVFRARDPVRLRGDKVPWVLKDDHGLLESERGWWIVVEGE